MRNLTIALDAMGGDHGVSVTIPAAVDALAQLPDLKLILVGDQAGIEAALAHLWEKSPQLKWVQDRLQIHHATEVVAMDESPALALRHKKNSSMRLALDLVKQGIAEAMVSAGNTGALVATARFVLKTLPGIDRPAIVVSMPSQKGVVNMLDLGANVDCTGEQLLQFAVMGAVLTRAVLHIQKPRVALLNIGEEEMKGNQSVQVAHRLIQTQVGLFDYLGFIEADQFYTGNADVIVCDGFVGNVALKSVEGIAKVIARFIKEEFTRNIFTKLAGLMVKPILARVGKRIDPRAYNGASLVGLKGIVLKSHGGADRMAMTAALKQAYLQIEQNIPQRIQTEMARWIDTGSSS